MALQDLANRMRAARSAVLVGYGDNPAVPLAIRGADRTPWPDPMDEGSVLAKSWHEGVSTLTEWSGDIVARSMIIVPLNDDKGHRLGLLVADRPLVTPFTVDDLAAAEEVARRHSAHIDLSVLFAGLRERAGLEERERLAREMHDGIAQEMVALGFGLDAAATGGPRPGVAARGGPRRPARRGVPGAGRPAAAHRRPAYRRAARHRAGRDDRRPAAELRLQLWGHAPGST